MDRLTSDPAEDSFPAWTPDSRRIIFSSRRAGARNVYWREADATGEDQRLTSAARPQFSSSVTPDGSHLLVQELFPTTGWDIARVPLAALATGEKADTAAARSERQSEPLIQGRSTEWDAYVSPNGRYVAYVSDETGTFEVYVRPYPRVDDGRWTVSAGGRYPVWARNGRELFYLDNESGLTSVAVDTEGSTFSAGEPVKLRDTAYWGQGAFDVSPDGQRFLFIKEGAPAAASTPLSFVVVLNWFEELKARVAAK